MKAAAKPTTPRPSRTKKLATMEEYAAVKFTAYKGAREAISDRAKWLKRAADNYPDIAVTAILLDKDDTELAATVAKGDADLWLVTHERIQQIRVSYEALVNLLKGAELRLLASLVRRELTGRDAAGGQS